MDIAWKCCTVLCIYFFLVTIANSVNTVSSNDPTLPLELVTPPVDPSNRDAAFRSNIFAIGNAVCKHGTYFRNSTLQFACSDMKCQEINKTPRLYTLLDDNDNVVYNISEDCSVGLPRKRRALRGEDRLEDGRRMDYRKTCYQQYNLFYYNRISNKNPPFTGIAIDLSVMFDEVTTEQTIVAMKGMSISVRNGKIIVETCILQQGKINFIKQIMSKSNVKDKRYFRLHFRIMPHVKLDRMTMLLYQDGEYLDPPIIFWYPESVSYGRQRDMEADRNRRAAVNYDEVIPTGPLGRTRRAKSNDGEWDDDEDDDTKEHDDDQAETTTSSSQEYWSSTTTVPPPTPTTWSMPPYTATTPPMATTTTATVPPPRRVERPRPSLPDFGMVAEGRSGARNDGRSGVIPPPPRGDTGASGFTGPSDPVFTGSGGNSGAGSGVTGFDVPSGDNDAAWFQKSVQMYFGFNYNRATQMNCSSNMYSVCADIGQSFVIKDSNARFSMPSSIPRCAIRLRSVIRFMCAKQLIVCRTDGRYYEKPCLSLCLAAQKAVERNPGCNYYFNCTGLVDDDSCYNYEKTNKEHIFSNFRGLLRDIKTVSENSFFTDDMIREAHTGISTPNEPYINNKCSCPARLTPMLNPRNPLQCVSHTYPDRIVGRLGKDNRFTSVQFANDGDLNTAYFTSSRITTPDHGLTIQLKPDTKIHTIKIIMNGEFPSGYLLVKAGVVPPVNQEQEVSMEYYVLQNISKICDNTDNTLLQRISDYKCATVQQLSDKQIPQFTLTLNIYDDRKHIKTQVRNLPQYRKKRASELTAPPQIDILKPHNIKLEFRGGELLDESISIAEIQVLNDNQCGCNPAGTEHTNSCKNGICRCIDIGMQVNTTKAGVKCGYYVDNMSPTKGPIDGGTLITIRGAFYGISSLRDVLVTSSIRGINFAIVSVSQNTIMLKTGSNAGAIYSSFTFTILLKRQHLLTVKEKFVFLANPEITNIYPRLSFMSGGMKQHLVGTNMDTVKIPEMKISLYYPGLNDSYLQGISMCKSINNTNAECTTPRFKLLFLMDMRNISTTLNGYAAAEDVVTLYNSTNRGQQRVAVEKVMRTSTAEIAIKLDGVKKPHVGGLKVDMGLIFNDPIIHPFEKQMYTIPSSQPDSMKYVIPISGADLSPGSMIDDYTITIGNSICNVLELASNQVKCQAPTHKNLIAKNVKPVIDTNVYVKIGDVPGKFKFSVGRIIYPKSSKTGIIVGVILGFVFAMLIIVAVICYMYRKRQLESKKSKSHLPLDTFVTENSYMSSKADYMSILDKEMYDALSSVLIPVEQITFDLDSKLGNGFYGVVIKGSYLGKQIALKTLKHEIQMQLNEKTGEREEKAIPHTYAEIKEFIQEGLIMKDFHHENVMGLTGIVNISIDNMGKMPYVTMPLMQNGDLKSYVEDHKIFSRNDLLNFGYQVAKGMQYLANKRFVHRDLACRNCMIDDKWVIKIADFGLSRDVYTSDYYRRKTIERKLPLPIMALEVLNNTGTHTVKSDVWSYGVLLWELWTKMQSPYQHIALNQIAAFLNQGQRLAKPSIAPNNMYALMHECWMPEAEQRPSFDEIVARSERLLRLDLSLDDDCYVMQSEREEKVPDEVKLVVGYISPGYKTSPEERPSFPSKREEAARYQNICEDDEPLSTEDCQSNPAASDSQIPPTYTETQSTAADDGYMQPLSSPRDPQVVAAEAAEPLDFFPENRSPATSFSEPLLSNGESTPSYDTPKTVDPSLSYSVPKSSGLISPQSQAPKISPTASAVQTTSKKSRPPIPSTRAPSREDAGRSVNNTDRPVLSRQQNTRGDSNLVKLPEVAVPQPPPSFLGSDQNPETQNQHEDIGYLDLSSC